MYLALQLKQVFTPQVIPSSLLALLGINHWVYPELVLPNSQLEEVAPGFGVHFFAAHYFSVNLISQ